MTDCYSDGVRDMKKPELKGSTIILTALFVFSCIIMPANGALTWTIETVDSENAGVGSSIVLDGVGHPWISYSYNTYPESLKVAHFTGSTWEKSLVDSTGDKVTSIAIDGAGNPVIAYLESMDTRVQYAHLVGPSWVIDTVDENCDIMNAISCVIDSVGNPHIAYIDPSDPFSIILKYVTYSGSSWNIENVPYDCDSCDIAALALDSTGKPCISYKGATGALMYIHKSGASWIAETADSTGGNYPSLKINKAGNPCISYFKNDGLHYAYFASGVWYKETVDSTVGLGYYSSLALDSLGYAHIAYRDNANSDLKYAYYDGASWHFETVDSNGDVGTYVSLDLDNYGNPYVSYRDETNRALKCAYSAVLLPSITPESDGAGVLLFSVAAAVGCFIFLKRKSK